MEKIKKIAKSCYLPFIIFAIILVCIHVPIQKTADDLWFGEILNNNNIIEYSISRYHNWTSRVIIETFLVILSNTNVSLLIWKILNILMFELLAYSTFKIFIKDIKEENKKTKLTWMLVISLLTIPITMLCDAGWIATTTNYLWVLAIGMYVLTLLKKKLNEEKITWYNAILLFLASIYASNQEQMAVVLLIMFTLYFIYMLKEKKFKLSKNKTAILIYIVIILNLIYILTCPGNTVRKEQETQTWYPEYEQFGIISKVQLGITSMMKYLVIDGRVVFITLTAIMAYYIVSSNRNSIYKIIGVIPFIGATFSNLFYGLTIKIFPNLTNLLNIYGNSGLIINETNKTDLSIYIPLVIYGIILLCVLINIYVILKNEEKWKLVSIIYLIGLMTRLIMGFSPTVFASGERPSLFLYFSFIIISLSIYKQLLKENRQTTNIDTIYTIIGMITLMNSIAS